MLKHKLAVYEVSVLKGIFPLVCGSGTKLLVVGDFYAVNNVDINSIVRKRVFVLGILCAYLNGYDLSALAVECGRNKRKRIAVLAAYRRVFTAAYARK